MALGGAHRRVAGRRPAVRGPLGRARGRGWGGERRGGDARPCAAWLVGAYLSGRGGTGSGDRGPTRVPRVGSIIGGDGSGPDRRARARRTHLLPTGPAARGRRLGGRTCYRSRPSWCPSRP